MSPKKLIASLILLLIFGFSSSITLTPSLLAAPAAEEQMYTCGMHPQVMQNKPGNCPICGMKLTPMKKQSGADNGMSTITIDSVTSQNMNLRTALVGRGPLERVVRTVGTVDFDESAVSEVSTKFKGWIEKLRVDTTGQLVHRGEPLFEIYSPELYSAQVEYLLALDQSTNISQVGADTLRATARARLRFFDVPDEEILALEQARQPRKAISINAPRDGIVVEKMAVEGQMVDAGMKLYRLADLGTVWVVSQVYEQDLPFIQLGQEATVTLSYLQDRKFRGRVTYIYPTVDDKTRTVRVRMEFHNPGYFLKPGMFATVQITARLSSSVLLVPDMAVLRSGEKNTVFIALEGGKFEARTIVLGPRAGADSYQVLSGLSEGDRIVTSGQFMLDSESQLREAIQKMRGGSGSPSLGASESSSLHAPDASPADNTVVYLCPMPEHVSLEYDHAGKCPLCGMTLVPVTRDTLSRIAPGGKVEYYTCPMPEHKDVHEAKPGKCPRCSMTLIPVMTREDRGEREGANPTNALPAVLYTCPMASDADVVSDQPGKCPKCEMDLVDARTVKHRAAAEANWRKTRP
jgi:RND family efflux transporter MFP subunit